MTDAETEAYAAQRQRRLNAALGDGYEISGRRLTEVLPIPQHLLVSEREVVDSEPYSTANQALKDDDSLTRAYMEVWDHYQAAYNAVQHRAMTDLYLARVVSLLDSILGRSVLDEFSGDDDDTFKRLISEAYRERARLLSRIDKVQDTLAMQANCMESQARLIADMQRHSARGQKAFDAFMMLGVKLGVNPVPTDPEEFVDAILRVMETLRDAKAGNKV